jgi:hypothetical protein
VDEFVRTIEFLTNYVTALETGVNKFAEALPLLTEQHIRKTAKTRLNSTFGHYMSKVKVNMNDFILVVELDKDDWLANAIEEGVDGWNMKQTHLRSPKAKTSKAGYKFMSIPIGAQKDKVQGTDKGKEIQKKINDALNNTKVGIVKLKMLQGGKVQETQEVKTGDPSFGGLYRTRIRDSVDDLTDRSKRAPNWQYVLFRTMSENPASMSKWEHPGIKPANIFRSTDRWLAENIEPLLESFIQEELQRFTREMGV